VNAGSSVNTGNGNTYLGHNANVTNNSTISNATALGAGAVVTASNTIQLGNSDITNINTNGKISSGTITYPNTVGLSGQVLTTDGSSQATWTTPASNISGSGSGSSALQILTTTGRDALGIASSGHLVFNTTTNTFQGSKAILPPYDNYTTTNYGFSEVRPGHSLTQTFTAGGQTISSAKIAIIYMGSGWASNTGSFTFAIHDDVNNYNLFSTTITANGAGDVIIPISGYDWSVYPPILGPLKLPVGGCSFVISSPVVGGGSFDFNLNGTQGVGTLTNTYWQSLGGTPAGYTTPSSTHPLSIVLYPIAQTGIIWVNLSN